MFLNKVDIQRVPKTRKHRTKESHIDEAQPKLGSVLQEVGNFDHHKVLVLSLYLCLTIL